MSLDPNKLAEALRDALTRAAQQNGSSNRQASTAKSTMDAMVQKGEDLALNLLKEGAARYAQPIPFKVGDLVEARQHTRHGRPGVPAIVLEVNPDAPPVFFSGDTFGSTGWGSRPNLRVLLIDEDGDMSPFWVEAADFKAYTPYANR